MPAGFEANRNTQKFFQNIRTYPVTRSRDLALSLERAAEYPITMSKTHFLTQGRARGGLNVDTNRLRSSISKSPVYKIGTTFQIDVGTNVPYGRYWEEGFVRGGKFHQRRFLAPAFIGTRSKIREELRQAHVRMIGALRRSA